MAYRAGVDWTDWRLKAGFALIKPTPNREKTKGGIYYAERYQPMDHSHGEIVRLGKGDIDCEVGDRVIFERYKAEHWDAVKGGEIALCRFEHIQAVILPD